MARMRILTANEQEVFDKPPLFDHRDRKKFFDFPKALLAIAATMRHSDHQIGFLVSCGYFRSTRRFFGAADFVERDIAYVASQLDHSVPPQIQYPDRTRQRHQNTILDFYGFASFDDDACNSLVTEIATMARMHLKPRLIFDRCVDFLIQKRVQIPSAYRLSDLIRVGLQDRKTELVALMDRHLWGRFRLGAE